MQEKDLILILKSKNRHPEWSEGSNTKTIMNYYVYIITNWKNTVLYTGVTNNLERRIYEHKNKLIEGFSSKYNLGKLVYYEQTDDIHVALEREKYIKGKKRDYKLNLIKKINPDWVDLSKDFE